MTPDHAEAKRIAGDAVARGGGSMRKLARAYLAALEEIETVRKTAAGNEKCERAWHRTRPTAGRAGEGVMADPWQRREVIGNATLYLGDALTVLRTLPDESVHCCVTSPPYWGLRDYGVEGQLGLESTPAEYVEKMAAVFREVRRVLRDDGTLWLNLGDSYAAPNGRSSGGTYERGPNSVLGHLTERQEIGAVRNWGDLPAKNLVGIPWRVAFALQADGWYLRQDIIWAKPNPMPESVRDRCTKAHEYLFLLAKSERYYFDSEAICENATQGDNGSSFTDERDIATKPGLGMGERKKNYGKRSVWTVATQPYAEAHFATFPPKLIEPCIVAGCPVGGTVIDPFNGSGTTGLVSLQHGRAYIGIELNPEYLALTMPRIENAQRQSRLFA
jgi:site-specific DNA-methyltransferase (adenine-specific)